MDINLIFGEIQKMRPSSFSRGEHIYYLVEKSVMREFMVMKQEDQVPAHLSVRDMKTLLLIGRSFLEEFPGIMESTDKNLLFKAELAWTTARHFCLAQMEEEIQKELDMEKQLSQLLGRKLTLEGLRKFLLFFRPGAYEEIRTLLLPLTAKLLKLFGGLQIPGMPLPVGYDRPASVELEQNAALLGKAVVDSAVKFILEAPDRKNMAEAASCEIGKLLFNSATPCLCRLGSIPKNLLLAVCIIAARSMVAAVFRRFERVSKCYCLDYYDSPAREAVIEAIQSIMDHREDLVEETLVMSNPVTKTKEILVIEITMVQNPVIQTNTRGVKAFCCGCWKRMKGCFSI